MSTNQVDGESEAKENDLGFELVRMSELSLASKAGNAIYCCSSDYDVGKVPLSFLLSLLSCGPSSSQCHLVIGGSMCHFQQHICCGPGGMRRRVDKRLSLPLLFIF